MKKFTVYLDVLEEKKYQITVEASNKLEAAKIAADKFENSMSEGLVCDVDFPEIRPEFEIDEKNVEASLGIEIEEEDDDIVIGEQCYQD